jgi:flagellar basal-body rod modification protein FlgD
MKPMDDTAFTAQMAQFTSLEQATQMSKDMKALRADSAMQSAAGMIGRQVTLNTKLGPVTGPVDSVDSSNGTINVGVGGVYYPLTQVTHVSAIPVLAPAA